MIILLPSCYKIVITKIFLEVIILYPTPAPENVISIYFNKTTENCAYFGILKTLQKGMILSYRHQLLKRTNQKPDKMLDHTQK